MFPVGRRVQIVCPGPFQGRSGTIRTAHCLPPLEEPLWFYHIELEGVQLKEPIWFRLEEVKPLPPSQPHPSPKSTP